MCSGNERWRVRPATSRLGLLGTAVIQDNVQRSVRVLGDKSVHEAGESAASPALVMAGMGQPCDHLQGRNEVGGDALE